MIAARNRYVELCRMLEIALGQADGKAAHRLGQWMEAVTDRRMDLPRDLLFFFFPVVYCVRNSSTSILLKADDEQV